MELRQVLRDLRQNVGVALAVLVLCVVAGGAAAFVPKAHYQSTLQVLVQPATNVPATDSIPVIEAVLPQLPTEATDSATVAKARATLSPQDQVPAVDVAATADTSSDVLTITATSTSASAASAMANAVEAEVKAQQPAAAVYNLYVPSPARVPGSPTNPRTPILIGAFGFGVILAVFAAMWAAGIRRRLSRVTEVKERIGANVLGEIPRSGVAGLRPAELFVKHSEPMAMEAFQELRSNLLISLPAGATATIGVTSCDPGEGKTSVATNIAWALAAQDRHVTAIDCDLRKPALHTQMGVPFGPGVTSRRTEDALAHASRTPNPYLDVIPAGIIDRHPSDVVSAHLPLLIEESAAAPRHRRHRLPAAHRRGRDRPHRGHGRPGDRGGRRPALQPRAPPAVLAASRLHQRQRRHRAEPGALQPPPARRHLRVRPLPPDRQRPHGRPRRARCPQWDGAATDAGARALRRRAPRGGTTPGDRTHRPAPARRARRAQGQRGRAGQGAIGLLAALSERHEADDAASSAHTVLPRPDGA